MTTTVEDVRESTVPSMTARNERRLRLRAPHFRRRPVERTRLLARLANGREQRVVRICAPAGFGKTILAAQLRDHDPRPSCWIALEGSDNDPVALLKDLVHMLMEVGSIAPPITRELESPAARIDTVVKPLLEEQLAGFAPFVLVLDDLEQVRHQDSLAILSFLVDHVPPGSQVVLVSRARDEVPLARLRAAGEVLDIRAADLAFDVSETRELLASGGVPATEDQVEEVRDRTEGWAAGIALGILSGERGAGTLDLPPAGTNFSDDLAGYLIEEVVRSQSPQVRRFLLASSLLRRMCPALCDAALEIDNSAQILAALEDESLFVVPLNGDGEWYRYHQLFRELLQTELRRHDPEVTDGVLSRAAAWYEDRGDPREAFEYAHACGDLARAGRVALGHAADYLARGEIETVRGWLAACTPEEMESDPQLAITGGWMALLSGEAGEAWRLAAVASQAGELDVPSPDGATSLRSSLANLRASLALDGVSQMRRDGEALVAAERSAGTRWAMDGWRQVATAHLLDGHPEEAIEAFAEVLSGTKARPDVSDLAAHCLGYSALAAADMGDWRRARKWAREGRAVATESGLQNVLQAIAPYTAHATVLLHDGLLLQATSALEHVVQHLPMLHAMRWMEADISLRCADLSLDLGDTPGALELADVARAALSHYPDPGMLLERLTALDARLASGGALELTPSELRLTPFLSSHLSLQEIGDRMYLSRATIKTHTDSIYRKLGVSSRSEAVDRLEELGVYDRSPARFRPPEPGVVRRSRGISERLVRGAC